MPFKSTPFYGDFEDYNAFQAWFEREMQRFERQLKLEVTTIPLYSSAPIIPYEGQIVRADGTNWDPGSGDGFYGYHSGAWVFLG